MKPPPTHFRKKHRWSGRGLLAGACLLQLLLGARSFALDPNKSIDQYNCQTWSQQDGLPANGINAIAQTDDGYLWLGASAGLIRFDGISFTLVGMAQTPGLRTTEIRSLAASPGGNLWFGIKLSAYGRYDGHGHWTLAKESSDGTDWDVPFVMESKDGRLWIGGERASVRSPDGQLQQLFTNEPTPIFANCGLEDSRGRIWVGTNRKGLYCLNQGKWEKFSGAAFDSVIITALAEDKEGRLWVAAENSLICYDAHGKLAMRHNPGGKVSSLLVDRRGALWVGSFGNGLLRCYNGVWSSLKKADGLADDFVLSLAEDKEGSLWIGTRGGLSQLTDVKLPTFGINEGLATDLALGVSASPRGGLWVGTAGGVAYFDGQAFIRNFSTNAELQTGYTKRVFEARNGDLYTLNGRNQINIYSSGKLLVRQPTTNMPVAMTEDAQGVVVSVGPDLFRVGRDYLTPFPFTNGVKPDLYWVINLATGRDGSILVAGENGVCRIKNGVFEQWTPGDGLADNHAMWAYEDADGTIWAGLEKGIARIRGREIRNIRRENGLYDGNIWAIVPDDRGRFWVDSNRGIFCVTRQELNDFCDGKISHVTSVSYDGPDSVKAADKFGQEQSACRTLDGRIWFPGARGVIMVDPPNISANLLPPPVHIASALANGHEMGITNGITIPPGNGELEFQYNALSYIAPQNIRFRYQLEGYDRQWVEAGDRRLAVYNNLKPGRYTFRVTAANADGIWNKTGDSRAIELLPYYYQTGWFYLLCGALALAALSGIYVWRVRYLTGRQQALQNARDLLKAEVATRTTELSRERDLLRALLDSSPDEVYFKDAQSRFLKSSKSQVAKFGAKDADEVIGKTDFDMFSEEHARPAFEEEQEIIRTGVPMIGRVEKEVWKDGRVTWVLSNKMPLRNEDGEIIGTFGISKDITAIKQAEAELAYQRDLLETLMNHSPDSIFFKDLQSRFVKLSRSEANNLLQVSLSRYRASHPADGKDSLPPHLASVEEFEKYVVGKSDADIYGSERADAFGHDEEEVMRTGRPMIGKIEQTICPDGSSIWHTTTKVPWRNNDGEIIGTFGTSRDISDLKNAETKLEQVHKELLETSRLAGMAEIATNVLHNIGNVLNSVNVSASLVVDSMKKSKAANLAKVAAMLREHEHDLGTFITSDAKGKQLPAYLGQLSEQLLADQKAAVHELDSLVKNIEHIKDVVSMQQNYARVSGVKEIINLRELVEDGLRMNAGALGRHRVEVIREFQDVPLINIDKHKVLQILVNLIRNAKHACQESERVDRRLTVRVANGEGRIKISVADNGIGVPPENLIRIFNHGFTTRKDGHGFGLHSGALAAKEMGGSLSVHSDGIGHGATFTLELPQISPTSDTTFRRRPKLEPTRPTQENSRE